MKNQVTSVLADGFKYVEGPRWHADRLWISDMWDFKVYRLDVDASLELVCEVPQRPAGIDFLSDGTPIIVSMADRKLMTIRDARLVEYADLSNLATGDVNDVLVDGEDRVYVGNFGFDLFGGADRAQADLLLVDQHRSARVVACDMAFPNGTIIKDGGRTLVIAETTANRLTAFDRALDGSLSNRRVYADLGERMPDGICADRAGEVWVSSFNTGEFLRVLEGGEVTNRVTCGDKRAVACQLGGADGRTLFCATFAGELNELQLKRAGAIETVRVEIPAAGFVGE
jgi:sugar lactone lactonase YvrE